MALAFMVAIALGASSVRDAPGARLSDAAEAEHAGDANQVQQIVAGDASHSRVIFDIEALRAAVPLAERLEPIVDSLRCAEGPAWSPAGFLVFSDVPADTLYKWSPADGLAVFRQPSRNANGNVFTASGDLITCEHGTRRVTRTSPGGSIDVLADSFLGQAFNSPNDVAIAPDGAVWFTDPTYGLGSRKTELDSNCVYRIDPQTREVARMADGFDQPNGIAFSSDGSQVYVADSGAPSRVVVFDVRDGGKSLAGPREFARIAPGPPDGLCVHPDGDLYVAASDGVQVFRPDGSLVARVPVPLPVSNVCFGGQNGDTLFLTARNLVFRLRMPRAIRTIPSAPRSAAIPKTP